jgi:hypothetical protein
MNDDDCEGRAAGLALLLTAQGIVWLCIGLWAGWLIWSPA